MVGQSKLLEVLPEYYGYVVFVAVDSFFVNMWMARNVVAARKKYKIAFPTMYSDDNNTFNCIQRAHQQTLELYPTFVTFLLLGGLEYPRFAAGAGAVYLLGRIAFAKGYYTGEPKNRQWGLFGMAGLLSLVGTTILFAEHQLGWNIPAWASLGRC